ncbi:MAG: hypothetical protein QOF30_2848 [Acidimicrobiaceae bacterium]|nr:hypothetical protein [Acidimicrobiaceae bacterium]
MSSAHHLDMDGRSYRPNNGPDAQGAPSDITVPVCATPGCGNPVAARYGTTRRPPIHCSRACRLALRVARRRPQSDKHVTAPPAEIIGSDGDDEIAVEMGHDPDDPTPIRSWTVTIRRGPHAVTVGHGLGRFAATALADDLKQLFNPQHPTTRRAPNRLDSCTPSEGIP